MNFLEGLVLSVIAVLIFALVHELLHYLAAKALGMRVQIIAKWWGFYVYLDETSGKDWRELPYETKKKYNIVAVTPYLLFIPFFVFLSLVSYEKSFLLYSISISLLIVNFVALPMEWMMK